MRKIVTLSLDKELYDKFRKYCKKKGLIVSRQFDLFMERELMKENVVMGLKL